MSSLLYGDFAAADIYETFRQCIIFYQFTTFQWKIKGQNPLKFVLLYFCYYSQVISREVFCHKYGKIPRHAGQNAITKGDLECILTKLL